MKEIDVSKSLIFSRNIEDLQKSLEYLNQEGYFSNSKNFSNCEEATLEFVEVANFVFSPYGFMHDGDRQVFSYFIPKSKVVFIEKEPKQKKLRQFKSIDEFFSVTGFKIGDVVQIKKFGNYPYNETSIFSGFRVFTEEEINGTFAIFCSNSRSLCELFKYYKYLKNDKWLRFGVEE